MEGILYYTKEDGKNKLLMGALPSDVSMIEADLKLDDPIFIKRLGHKPQNLYALIDGKEFKLLLD
ncbi:hypothetical protein [Lactobacillus intestinalis]|uniref:hypothetical protein n=1 Tax=Lactobacillus intestinalis TaxID=151781 RepID=UPI0025A9D43A|nr:hypothetical protein [Lactobacillus intestinalis]